MRFSKKKCQEYTISITYPLLLYLPIFQFSFRAMVPEEDEIKVRERRQSKKS